MEKLQKKYPELMEHVVEVFDHYENQPEEVRAHDFSIAVSDYYSGEKNFMGLMFAAILTFGPDAGEQFRKVVPFDTRKEEALNIWRNKKVDEEVKVVLTKAYLGDDSERILSAAA